MVLRVVTTGEPERTHAQKRAMTHGYKCRCDTCRVTDTSARTCRCDRPNVYADQAAEGEASCLRCGKPPAQLKAAA